MRIISKDNIDFVLPTGFAAELTKYNVLLSSAGEQTAPITLPPDPVNMKLIGYSNRTDAYYKPLTDLEVLVSDGLFHRWCNMGIHSANDEDGISCTLYFDSGSFYSLSEDKKLASLPWPVIKSPTYATQTLDQRVAYLVALIKSELFTPTPTQIFNVTQVLTTQDYNYIKTRVGLPATTTVVQTNKLVLNGYILISDTITQVLPAPRTLTELSKYYIEIFGGKKLQGEIVQLIKEDDNNTTLPLGYGMTPFLKVKYMLSIIFSGYTVDTSAITAVFPDFDLLESIINNVADAIVGGVLNFSQLVPDVTVKEFISTLEERYAGKFVMNNVSKVVTFVRYATVVAAPDMDITPYLCKKTKQGSSDFSSLIVKYKSDQITVTDDNTDKQKTIEIDFMERKIFSFEKTFKNQSSTEYYYPMFKLYLCDIGDIVHKNLTIVINGITKTETGKTITDVQIITVDRLTNSFFYRYDVTPIEFHTAVTNVTGIYPMLGNLQEELMHPDVKSFYTEYINFLQNSNIPISAEMDFPTVVLESMNLQKPKLLQGQPVMIESIKQTIGTNDTQTVEMRTLRIFNKRT